MFLAAPATALALAALAACGGDKDGGTGSGPEAAPVAKLFPDDFKGVCSGASVSAATAYDPAATSHKAVYLATYKDDLLDQSTSLPDDWTVQFSPEKDAYKAIDLVVCAKRTAQREVKICDGYKDDGKPTANKVRWHTATFALSVHEATTGKKLGETTAEATGSTCPMFMNFDGDSDTVDGYASLSDSTVTDFLRPHMKR